MFNIEDALKALPEKPGVYIMRDKNDTILYVGKAINLKKRVTQYFRKNVKSARIERMVSKIDHFEYIITDNEAEALILECNLIKKHRPHYNVMLKDDKSYPYIKVTINEKFPRIYITRRVEQDKEKYYGPFTDVSAVKEMLEFIKGIFPLKSCKKDLKNVQGNSKPCLNYHIKKCLAPCMGDISVDSYRDMVSKICDFLEGKHDEVIKKLNEEMKKESENMEYEKAAGIRDKITSIKKVGEKQKVSNFNYDDSDIIGLARDTDITCIEVFAIRNGKLIGREQYKLSQTTHEKDEDLLESFLKEFYNSRWHIPGKIFIRHKLADKGIFETWLSGRRGGVVEIITPQKGDKDKLLEMAEKNARDYIKRETKQKNVIMDIYENFGLSKIPKKIEAYDISNTGSDNIVGGMITVINGDLKPNLYRKFKIKNSYTQDDINCTYEVLDRRLNEVDSEDDSFKELPDLILADGGKGQVGAIKRALSEHNLDIEVLGMVKDDKHKIKSLLVKGKNIRMALYPDILKFIYTIQEEVHRFAIGYHHKLNNKGMSTSELDRVEGIGEIRKENLLKHFKSLDRIKEASVEEISKVKGMNKNIAEKLKKSFSK